jgi:hypothetical protein
VLATVHRALAATDRGETPPATSELDRVEQEDELAVAAGVGNES